MTAALLALVPILGLAQHGGMGGGGGGGGMTSGGSMSGPASGSGSRRPGPDVACVPNALIW